MEEAAGAGFVEKDKGLAGTHRLAAGDTLGEAADGEGEFIAKERIHRVTDEMNAKMPRRQEEERSYQLPAQSCQ